MSRLNDHKVVHLLGVCYKELDFIMIGQFLQKYTAIALLPKSSGEIPTSMIILSRLPVE